MTSHDHAHHEAEPSNGAGTDGLGGAVALFGAAFIDPVVGLALAGWAIVEGRRAWRGEQCC